MKKYICILLVFAVLFCMSVNAVSGTTETETVTGTEAETTEEITEEAPTEEDDSDNTARDFMNINIYMFAGGVVLFIICTVVYFIMRAKKKKANSGKQ